MISLHVNVDRILQLQNNKAKVDNKSITNISKVQRLLPYIYSEFSGTKTARTST